MSLDVTLPQAHHLLLPFLPSDPSSTTRESSNSSNSSMVGFNIPPSLTIPNPSNSCNSNSSWSGLSDLPSPDELISPGGSSLNPASLPFYSNGGVRGREAVDLFDELQLQEQLSFLNERSSSPNLCPKSSDLYYAPPPQLDSLSSSTGAGSYWGGSLHRRSCSVSDVLGSDDAESGFGWRPCLYFARGFCKNGSSCRFVHGGDTNGSGGSVGSPNKLEMMEQCHDLLRSKSAHQQRLAAASQLLGSSPPSPSLPYSPKFMNFLLQQQQQSDSPRAAAAALLMGEDLHKLGRTRLDRNDLVNPASRQIYLTFPADSTFREEDVSNYFSLYGPVQDVRIPYQQKRMFGFVTFVYPETVKMILAKGNPHFVCDARVLVKPYKEKGKVPEKFRKQQQVGRREFSPCGTPTGLNSRDPFDLQLGARMIYNAQDLLLRRKLEEQADLQQALELQSRRLMGLQLLEMKKHHHHRALSTGSPIPSPTHSHSFFNQSAPFSPLHSSTGVLQESGSSPLPAISMTAPHEMQAPIALSSKESTHNQDNGRGREDGDLQESLEHNLPDSPFASPTKGSGDYFSAFSYHPYEFEKGSNGNASAISAPPNANNNLVPSSLIPPVSSSLDMASFKSFNCQMPRLSSGHGGLGMCAGTSGPTCPIGI